jgi:heparan-alpha-glucosaminide N-acetyltransferase
MLPFNFSFGRMNSHWIKLIESIWGVSAWLIVAFVLYRKKVFVTV